MFKVGGVATIDRLENRLAQYNSGRARGDDFFFSEWYTVTCYTDVEKRLETLVGRFRDSKRKEIYVMHYTNLKYIVEYIINRCDEEIDEITRQLEEFIRNLDRRQLRPVIVQPKPLNRVQIQRVGQPDIVITTNNTPSLIERIELYIGTLQTDTQVINAKQVFDSLEIKSGRRASYPILNDIVKRLLPRAKMVKY
jgi:hypothetical protein